MQPFPLGRVVSSLLLAGSLLQGTVITAGDWLLTPTTESPTTLLFTDSGVHYVVGSSNLHGYLPTIADCGPSTCTFTFLSGLYPSGTGPYAILEINGVPVRDPAISFDLTLEITPSRASAEAPKIPTANGFVSSTITTLSLTGTFHLLVNHIVTVTVPLTGNGNQVLGINTGSGYSSSTATFTHTPEPASGALLVIAAVTGLLLRQHRRR